MELGRESLLNLQMISSFLKPKFADLILRLIVAIESNLMSITNAYKRINLSTVGQMRSSLYA